MYKYILIVFFIPIMLISCSSAQEKTADPKESKLESSGQPKKGIDFENALFIDVRTPAEFESGTFENSKNIPLNELESRLDEINKDKQVVVFCRSGGRASNALQILESNGFKNVVNGINTSNLESLKNK